MSTEPLDPRWEWVETRTLGGDVDFLQGRCKHLEVVPVESVAGETVAHLCLTCDGQLPAEWSPDTPPTWAGAPSRDTPR